jgi:hypothetical protein
LLVKHIFVYVVDRPDDPFAGLRVQLARAKGHQCVDVRLSPANYEVVRKTEYSAKKNLRVLYYSNVFDELWKSLETATAQCSDAQPCILYFSDEGVWAELCKDFRCKLDNPNLFAVNVQHGFEHHVRPRSLRPRRFVNSISRLLYGYPALGLGCFGGSGPGVFDLYLTYDQRTADFIGSSTGSLAVSCPELIKHGFLDRYRAAVEARNGGPRRAVMFAAQPTIKGIAHRPGIRCSTQDVLRALVPLAAAIVGQHGRKFVVRRHPGMDAYEFESWFRQSRLSDFAEIDRLPDLASSLAESSIVMSFDSTVLWEASLVGLLPVSVQGWFYEGHLEFFHHVLSLGEGFEQRLQALIRLADDEPEGAPEAGSIDDFLLLVDALLRRESPPTYGIRLDTDAREAPHYL